MEYKGPWDEAEVERLVTMYNQGITTEDMAERLSRSALSTTKKISWILTNEPGRLQRKKTPKKWTEDEDRALLEHYKTGASMSTIANAMGRTKNQIIGRVSRLRPHHPEDLRPRPKAAIIKSVAEAAIYRRAKSKPKKAAKAKLKSAAKEAERFAQEAEAAQPELVNLTPEPFNPRNKKLVQLQKHQCRYPTHTDRSGHHRFCGRKTKDKSSWCEHHHDIVFIKRPNVA